MSQNWVNKLNLEYIEEEDGSGTIHIEWDETDPELKWWTDLGSKGQETFIIDALQEALDCYVN